MNAGRKFLLKEFENRIILEIHTDDNNDHCTGSATADFTCI